MTPIYDVTPLLVAQVPQVPDPIAAQALLLAARDLCRDTGCWRYEASDVDVAENEPLLTFYDLPSDSQIVSVAEVILDKVALVKASLDQLSRRYSGGWATEVGTPIWFYLGTDRNQIRLVPIPSTSGLLYARLILEPTLLASSLDTVLLDRHLDILMAGALGRLLRYPDRSWTHFQLAAAYQAQFEQGKRVIRSQAADGFQPGVPRSVTYGGI